jgi:hypothetical protein
MEEVWKLRHMEPGLFGMVGLEEEEPPSPGIQLPPRVKKPALKERKEAVTKDTWKSAVGMEDGAAVVEEQEFRRKNVDCFAFGLHDLGVLKR